MGGSQDKGASPSQGHGIRARRSVRTWGYYRTLQVGKRSAGEAEGLCRVPARPTQPGTPDLRTHLLKLTLFLGTGARFAGLKGLPTRPMIEKVDKRGLTLASALHLSQANPLPGVFLFQFPPTLPLITSLCFPATRSTTLRAGSALLSPLLCQPSQPWALLSLAAPSPLGPGGTSLVSAGHSVLDACERK